MTRHCCDLLSDLVLYIFATITNDNAIKEVDKFNFGNKEEDINFAKDLEHQYGRLPERLSPQEERGRIKGQRGLVEATIVAERNGRTNEPYSKENRASQESAIKKYAQENGTWVKDYKQKFGESDTKGAESDVYVNPKSQSVVKVNNTIHYVVICFQI